MSFLYPEFIYLMLPVLLVLFGLLLTQREPYELFFASRILARLRVDSDRLSAKARNVFYFLMFFFIILALADPVIEGGEVKVKRERSPLYIAIDISASMLCEDRYPNRLEYAKLKIEELLKGDVLNDIGLIAFAKNSYLVTPLTRDHELLRFLLKPLQSATLDEQGTNILTLLKAVDHLSEPGREKRVLLFTDGGDKASFAEEIAYARKQGIRVYVLGVGTAAGGRVPKPGGGYLIDDGKPVISRLNPRLETLASASGGGLVQVNALASLVDKSSTEEALISKPIYYHLFLLPTGLAMLMLLLATSSFYRGEKYYLPSLVMLGLAVFEPVSLKAGLFDYQRLDAAKRAYENEGYAKSSRAYQHYALEHQSLESTYNAANGYYRMGRYKEAVGLYESIRFIEAEKNHQLYHNLGNALARLGSEADLTKAIEAYKKALAFREDPETRANLQAVEKALLERDKQQRPMPLPGSPSPASSERSPQDIGSSDAKNTQSSPGAVPGEESMSEREAVKWLRDLEKHQRTLLYPIAVENPEEGAEHDKPW